MCSDKSGEDFAPLGQSIQYHPAGQVWDFHSRFFESFFFTLFNPKDLHEDGKHTLDFHQHLEIIFLKVHSENSPKERSTVSVVSL